MLDIGIAASFDSMGEPPGKWALNISSSLAVIAPVWRKHRQKPPLFPETR